MYACNSSKPQGLEEHPNHELLNTGRDINSDREETAQGLRRQTSLDLPYADSTSQENPGFCTGSAYGLFQILVKRGRGEHGHSTVGGTQTGSYQKATPCILNMSGAGFATNLQIWFWEQPRLIRPR